MPSTNDQITNLDAELDALVTPTTAQVAAVTQDYDAGIVAASAVRRAGGGGGGGGALSMIGPFTVNWNTPNVNEDYIELDGATLAAGAVVVRAWATVTTTWTASEAGNHHQLYISRGSGTGALTTYAQTLLQPGAVGDEVAATHPAASDGSNPTQVAIIQDGGSNLYVEVYAEAGNFTDGSLDVYALIYTPA